MPQRNILICQDCKNEWETEVNQLTKACKFCGSIKVYRSHQHKRAAKKSRNKERWSYRVR